MTVGEHIDMRTTFAVSRYIFQRPPGINKIKLVNLRLSCYDPNYISLTLRCPTNSYDKVDRFACRHNVVEPVVGNH